MSDDLQAAETGAQQLAFFEQECRIARLTEAPVAAGEGFVDQHAAGWQRRRQRGEQRPVQVIRHHDDAEAAGEEAGRLVALAIARKRLQPWVAGQWDEPREVTDNTQNRVAETEDRKS